MRPGTSATVTLACSCRSGSVRRRRRRGLAKQQRAWEWVWTPALAHGAQQSDPSQRVGVLAFYGQPHSPPSLLGYWRQRRGGLLAGSVGVGPGCAGASSSGRGSCGWPHGDAAVPHLAGGRRGAACTGPHARVPHSLCPGLGTCGWVCGGACGTESEHRPEGRAEAAGRQGTNGSGCGGCSFGGIDALSGGLCTSKCTC